MTLQLSVKGQREDVPIDVSIREHTILFKLIVNQESQEVYLFEAGGRVGGRGRCYRNGEGL